jgi:hypothetical protein
VGGAGAQRIGGAAEGTVNPLDRGRGRREDGQARLDDRRPGGEGGARVDTKSAGILGVCLIVAALVVALVPRPQAPAPAGPQAGRFQMGGVPGHAYVLDTATGQVWEDFAPAGQGSSSADFSKPKVK